MRQKRTMDRANASAAADLTQASESQVAIPDSGRSPPRGANGTAPIAVSQFRFRKLTFEPDKSVGVSLATDRRRVEARDHLTGRAVSIQQRRTGVGGRDRVATACPPQPIPPGRTGPNGT